jgi:hypothetical protein
VSAKRRGAPKTGVRILVGLTLLRVAAAPIGPVGLALVAVALVVLAAPWALARWVAIPLGWPRVAGWLAWLADDRWDGDAVGGRLVGVSLALLGAPRATSARAFEPAALALAPLGPVGVVGAGLLAAAAGERDRARLLLASVDELPAGATPAAAARLGRTWLLADALARGAWAEAERCASQLGTRRARLYALASARLSGRAPAGDAARVTDAALEHAWRRSGLWRSLDRPLVERALAFQPTPPAPPVEPEGHDPLRAALSAHAAVVGHAAPPSPTALVALARAWDAALAAPAVLPPTASPPPLADLEHDLAELALAAGHPLPDEDGVLRGAHRRLRQRALDEVEAACRALDARFHAGRALPPLLEWVELARLRDAHARAVRVGGLPARRLAFPIVHDAVCPAACRLWNDRREHTLAGALFRWLLAEAEAVGDERMAEHERKNAR